MRLPGRKKFHDGGGRADWLIVGLGNPGSRYAVAGHNGLKSLKQGLGSADFRRIRVGVGRPDTTDPEIVSAHVLGRFSEPTADVRDLIERAASEAERVVSGQV